MSKASKQCFQTDIGRLLTSIDVMPFNEDDNYKALEENTNYVFFNGL